MEEDPALCIDRSHTCNRYSDVCHCIHLVMRELRERCKDAQTKQEVLEMQYRQTIGELLLEALAD